MHPDKVNLKQLKIDFVERYKDDELYSILKQIYEIYENELLQQSQSFFKKLFKVFSIKENDEFDKEALLYDYMLQVCDYLHYMFTIIHLEYVGYESQNEPFEFKLIVFNTQEEFDLEYQKLVDMAQSKGISISYTQLNLNFVKHFINRRLMQPNLLLKMFTTKKKLIQNDYKIQLSKEKKKALKGEQFLGKKLTDENKKLFKEKKPGLE